MLALLKTAGLKDDVELQPHQQDALEHAKGKPGTVLSHGLGSGKTLTGIAIGEQQGGNTLAVTPASLTSNYEKEVEKFVEPDRQDAHKAVSYSKFRRDPQKHVDEHQPDTMILDELHRLRNPTKARKAVDQVRPQVDKAVGMTASMVNNHPSEVAPLTNTVVGDRVIGREEFNERFIDNQKESPGILGRIMGAEGGEKESIKNQDELRETLSPYIHRYAPDKSGPDYPDVEAEEVDVPMGDRQDKLVREIADQDPVLAYKMRNNLPPSKEEAKNLNAFMQAQRQVSNTPATHDTSVEDPVEASPKMQQVLEDMEGQAKEDENFRGVVYSNYLGAGAEPIIENSEAPAELYHGGLSKSQRDRVLDRFEKGDTKVLGLSPAGAEGIDLKGVKQMSVLEPDWNPETTNQAIGRAVRYQSHDHLPEDERNVQVKKYRSTHQERLRDKLPFKDKDTSPDQYLHNVQQDKQRLNDEFYEALDQKG